MLNVIYGVLAMVPTTLNGAEPRHRTVCPKSIDVRTYQKGPQR
jgi:hypothetical protein